MKNVTFSLLLVAGVMPLHASNPGEPLDCTDFVLEPGYTCSAWVSFPCDLGNEVPSPWCDFKESRTRVTDTQGQVIRLEVSYFAHSGCPGSGSRIEIVRFNGTTEEVIGSVADRCNNPPADGDDNIDFVHGGVLEFEPFTGALLIPFDVRCSGASCSNSGGPIPFYNGRWVASIEGFATTFDILQTFTPTAGTPGFHVPYMPDGFQFADWFDAYYGDLATVGDWSQAQALQCGFPATAPSVGDYLTIGDTLPDPGPGQGRYYLTASHFMGATRIGRRRTGGVFSGRDPAALPECN